MSGAQREDGPDGYVSIEMLYQQRMTVRIPVDEPPATPRDAWHLVKNADPEFVGDALPCTWEDVNRAGNLEVVDITEGEYGSE